MEIKEIRLLECSFAINREYAGDGLNIAIESVIGFNSTFEEDSKIVTCFLNAFSKGENLPFHFKAEVGGKFIIDEDEVENLKPLCRVNFPAVLLPYLRENIAELTRRAGFPPYNLPVVNFIAVAQQADKEQSKEIFKDNSADDSV
jgi:preprotein translocase subunit SecB